MRPEWFISLSVFKKNREILNDKNYSTMELLSRQCNSRSYREYRWWIWSTETDRYCRLKIDPTRQTRIRRSKVQWHNQIFGLATKKQETSILHTFYVWKWYCHWLKENYMTTNLRNWSEHAQVCITISSIKSNYRQRRITVPQSCRCTCFLSKTPYTRRAQ